MNEAVLETHVAKQVLPEVSEYYAQLQPLNRALNILGDLTKTQEIEKNSEGNIITIRFPERFVRKISFVAQRREENEKIKEVRIETREGMILHIYDDSVSMDYSIQFPGDIVIDVYPKEVHASDIKLNYQAHLYILSKIGRTKLSLSRILQEA